MMGFRPILSDSQPKNMKPGVASTSAIAVRMLVVAPSTLQHSLQEKQRVELPRVPHHGLAHHRAQQAMITIFKLLHWPNASDSGAFEVVPGFFILRNTGLSDSCMRIHRETASRTMETRNGMRQPQALNASSPSRCGCR